MKDKWQQLDAREQKTVLCLVPVLIIFILYSFIWQPLNESLAKNEAKLVRQQALLMWVKENTDRFKAQAGGNKRSRDSSASSIVNRTSKQYQITLSRIQAQGKNVQVWIDEVPFSSLLGWLEQLSSKEGLSVINIDLSVTDKSGVVKVRRLQLGQI